jgi:glycosyltransferase involved in cell wall biosynthesis
MDNISVIIRNRNEERYIGYAIQSVLDTFDKPEIIVVDNNSTDNSMGIVNTYDFENIKTYNMDSYTPGKSINYGVTKCSNDYVLVLSAHSQIMNCEFGKIKGLLEEHCVVGGKQIPIWNGKKISRRYVWSHFVEKDVINQFSESENRYFLHNAFAFYRKQILIDNPFDETLSGKEDRYWVNDMINKGAKSYYNSDIICHHHYTDNGATWKGIG